MSSPDWDEKLDELGRMREAFQNLERRHAELRVAYDAEICRLRELVVLAGEKPGTSLVEPVPLEDVDLRHLAAVDKLRRASWAPGSQTMVPKKKKRRAGVTTDEPSRKRTKGRGVRTVDTIAGGGSSSKRSSREPRVPRADRTTESNAALAVAALAAPVEGEAPPLPPTRKGVDDFVGSAEPVNAGNPASDQSDWLVVHNPEAGVERKIDLHASLDVGGVACAVAFSPDGAFLAVGSARTAVIYAAEDGREVLVLRITLRGADAEGGAAGNASAADATLSDETFVRAICWSPDGKMLLTGSEDGSLVAFSATDGSESGRLENTAGAVHAVAWSADGTMIATGAGDGVITVWDASFQPLRTLDGGDATPTASTGLVTSLAFSPDSARLVTGSLDGVARLWDPVAGKLLHTYQGHADAVYSVAYSGNGDLIATGSLDTTVRVWAAGGERQCIHTVRGHDDYVLAVAFLASDTIVSGSKDRTVQLISVATGRAEVMLKGHTNSVLAVGASTAGQQIATAGGDQLVRVWALA